jgi:phosphatidylglycerophosphate synthase
LIQYRERNTLNRQPLLWRVPDRPLRASFITSKLVGLVAVVALANVAGAALPVGDRYALKAAALFALIMGLSIGFLQEHHPFTRFGAANQITTVRAILVALVAALVGEPEVPAVAAAAVAASVAATLLDGVDGWLARRDRTASRFGARFDMEIDALLILALSVLAWRHGKAGEWVVASGLLRYLFIAAGVAAPRLRAPLPASRRRQSICVIQIAALTLIMLPVIRRPASMWIAAAALVLLSYSFLTDTVWLWRRAA